jgi:hypothetical protein
MCVGSPLTPELVTMRSATAETLVSMAGAVPATVPTPDGTLLREVLLARAQAVLEGQWDATPELALTWRVPPAVLDAAGVKSAKPDLARDDAAP